MLRRCLLLLLVLALPLQGAFAASRMCLAAMEPAGDAQHEHHAQAGHDMPAAHAGGSGHDHAAGSCSLCAACCLAVAIAPPAPQVAATLATYAPHRPFAVPVPHNIADGLERPPRTI